MDKAEIPTGSDEWQWRHQNYARLLLKAGMRANDKFDRTAIDSVLNEVERIQGKDQREILSAFLNHERKSILEGVELVKPRCVIDQELAFQQSQFDPQSKEDKHEQGKREIADSDEFMKKLTA